MRRGEIRWYKFQPPDKNRPVLILSRDPVIEY
ncbi:MAG: type II toxin-antitoxin system PemK/MazF family toxin, partial [Deltaproteobacteria bacterium]